MFNTNNQGNIFGAFPAHGNSNVGGLFGSGTYSSQKNNLNETIKSSEQSNGLFGRQNQVPVFPSNPVKNVIPVPSNPIKNSGPSPNNSSKILQPKT